MRIKDILSSIITIILCICLVSSCNDERIISYGFGVYYDTVDKVTISDLETLIVLEACESNCIDLTLPNEFHGGKSINYVGDSAFSGNNDIVNVTIPDGYTHIGYFSFMDCQNLETVYIGKDLFYFGEGAFEGSYNIEEFSVSAENLHCYSVDGCVLRREDEVLLASNGNIPSISTGIYHSVFRANKNISDIVLPDGIKWIGSTSFSESSLESIVLSKNLEKIFDYAFSYTNLKEIYIPASVGIMGKAVFAGIDGIVINCEAKSQPESWDSAWIDNCENYTVNWNVKNGM